VTGPNLRLRRKELGFKLRDVADACGIAHIQQVSEWERGKVRPGSKHLAKLAEVLGLEIADLLPRT
jgi:transcriptional regulator with XRE-family HTH domain